MLSYVISLFYHQSVVLPLNSKSNPMFNWSTRPGWLACSGLQGSTYPSPFWPPSCSHNSSQTSPRVCKLARRSPAWKSRPRLLPAARVPCPRLMHSWCPADLFRHLLISFWSFHILITCSPHSLLCFIFYSTLNCQWIAACNIAYVFIYLVSVSLEFKCHRAQQGFSLLVPWRITSTQNRPWHQEKTWWIYTERMDGC